MIPLFDAVVLSLSTVPRRRIAEALRTWYPLPPGSAQLGPGACDQVPALDLVFQWMARSPGEAAQVDHARRAADAALKAAARWALDPIPWGDPRYPALLAEIPDPPAVLWLRGRADALVRPLVAIVGARAASAYGTETAARLAAELASRGVGVVSGLARGIDGAAHRGALDGEGATVAVLGSGADVIYPAEHVGLAREIEQAGAVVSEFQPGTPPLPFHFPMRNRIISGLSSGVVVVEASERSGSLITAHAALEQGREVMAVPGSILNGRNAGGHALIKDGAALIECADDVLGALGLWAFAAHGEQPGLPADTDPLLRWMEPGEACDVDQLLARSGLQTKTLLARLLELELAGAIRRDAAGRFVRSRRSC